MLSVWIPPYPIQFSASLASRTTSVPRSDPSSVHLPDAADSGVPSTATCIITGSPTALAAAFGLEEQGLDVRHTHTLDGELSQSQFSSKSRHFKPITCPRSASVLRIGKFRSGSTKIKAINPCNGVRTRALFISRYHGLPLDREKKKTLLGRHPDTVG